MRIITIAGGGLAGLALGVGLRQRGVPVELSEAGSYPRHRVCGEFISGVSQQTLVRLGIAAELADARQHREVAWLERGRLLRRDLLPEPALGISRWRLDARLAARFQQLGGNLATGTRAQPVAGAGRVWAAGRRPQRSGWLGLKCHFHGVPMQAELEMHLGRGGYVGLVGVEDGRVNVCGLFPVDRTIHGHGRELLDRYLRACGLDALATTLVGCVADDASFCATAGFALGRQPPLAGLAVLGDAAAMIPPFTGNGMTMAFEAAEAALDPLNGYACGQLDWPAAMAGLRRAQHRLFRRRLTAAALLHPFLTTTAGQRLLVPMARSRLLPFQQLLGLLRSSNHPCSSTR